MRLWRKGRSLAPERRQPSRIEAWSPESQIDGVAGAEDGPDAADVGLVARGEDDRVVGLHPLGELPLELDVQRRGAVEQPRAGHAGPVGLQRLPRGVLDPLVGRQPQIVVGAEHHRLPPLHLHHRPRLRGQHPEVGQQIVLPRHLKLLRTIVIARLVEDVDGRAGGLGHGGSVAPGAVAGRPEGLPGAGQGVRAPAGPETAATKEAGRAETPGSGPPCRIRPHPYAATGSSRTQWITGHRARLGRYSGTREHSGLLGPPTRPIRSP